MSMEMVLSKAGRALGKVAAAYYALMALAGGVHGRPSTGACPRRRLPSTLYQPISLDTSG